jgi:DNA-binding NtrC family response regulator
MNLAEFTETGPVAPHIDEGKKTILIYSPDQNFCVSLYMLFQDKYNVVTTTNAAMLESFITHYSASLVIVDESPSKDMIERLDTIKRSSANLPIIMVYVYSQKEFRLDMEIRNHVDSIFYKPFDVSAVSKHIDELLPG